MAPCRVNSSVACPPIHRPIRGRHYSTADRSITVICNILDLVKRPGHSHPSSSKAGTWSGRPYRLTTHAYTSKGYGGKGSSGHSHSECPRGSHHTMSYIHTPPTTPHRQRIHSSIQQRQTPVSLHPYFHRCSTGKGGQTSSKTLASIPR